MPAVSPVNEASILHLSAVVMYPIWRNTNMSVKLKLCIANLLVCLCIPHAQAQPTVSPVALIANMIANVEICSQNYPGNAGYFSRALNIWKTKNTEAYQAALNYPGFNKIVSETRRDLIESGQIKVMHLEDCIAYADSISGQ